MPEEIEPELASLPKGRRVRRAPNFATFLITGGGLGALLGLWLAGRDETTGGYSDSTAIGLFIFIFAALGALVAAIVAVLVDKHSLKKPPV